MCVCREWSSVGWLGRPCVCMCVCEVGGVVIHGAVRLCVCVCA